MRSRAGAVTLLVLAIFIGLAHVCAEPSDAHMVSETPYAAPEPHDDAFHAASCDAILPSPAVDLTPTAGAWLTYSVMPMPIIRAAPTAASPVEPKSSPPLFLLHASFLI